MEDSKKLKLDPYFSPAQCMARLLNHPGKRSHLDPTKPSIWDVDPSSLRTVFQASFERTQELARFRDLL